MGGHVPSESRCPGAGDFEQADAWAYTCTEEYDDYLPIPEERAQDLRDWRADQRTLSKREGAQSKAYKRSLKTRRRTHGRSREWKLK